MWKKKTVVASESTPKKVEYVTLEQISFAADILNQAVETGQLSSLYLSGLVGYIGSSLMYSPDGITGAAPKIYKEKLLTVFKTETQLKQDKRNEIEKKLKDAQNQIENVQKALKEIE